MQVSMKFLRELGFIKIANNDFPLDNIIQLDLENRGSVIQAWSFLDEYGNKGSLYHSIDRLVEKIGGKTDERSKRRFRDTWSRIWQSYMQAIKFDDGNIQGLLHDFGLRLAFIKSDDEVIRRVARFYDDVIDWYIWTCVHDVSEDILRKLVADDIQVLRGYWRKC